MHKAALSLERNIVDRVTNADNTAPEARVEKMLEYGYRKSNYGPDEVVTDAHGNPIAVANASSSVEGVCVVIGPQF